MCQTRASFCGSLLVSFLLMGAGFYVGNLAEPNGDLPIFYAVETCPNQSAAFSVGSVIWDVNVLRAPAAQGAACQVEALTSPISITLEASDGYRGGASYSPVILVQNGAYALLAFSIRDARGSLLLPDNIIALGPDNYYPWSAHGATPLRATPTDTPAAPPSSSSSSSSSPPPTVASPAVPPSASSPPPPTLPATPALPATSRRLLYASPVDDEAEEADEAEGAAAGGAVMPTARRLLKGGFSSSFSSSRSSSSASRSSSASYSRGACARAPPHSPVGPLR